MRRAAHAAAVVVLGAVVTFASSVSTDAAVPDSLPAVASGHRPGPAVLYSTAPDIPQLQHHDARFEAPFVPVSGTEVYADGEYIYTDHLYDDFGSDTNGTGGQSLSPNTGDLTYSGDVSRHRNNAADLFEFRIAPDEAEIAYRFSLNTLVVRDSTMIALAFDRDGNPGTGSSTLAKDPGAPFPGTDEVLFAWGTGAQWSRWTGSAWSATPVDNVTADLDTNQITVVVPRAVADPTGVWRATLAVGLHDPSTGGWLAPTGSSVSDPNPADILNLGFRFDEPVTTDSVPPDTNQAAALRAKNPTRYQRDIDFAALAANTDRSNVPVTGTMVRYFPSRLNLGEGKDFSKFPGYLGRLQPYSLYVPTTYSPEKPVGFTLNLHSLSEHHWQYNGSKGVQQMGEGRANIVATPLARGDDGWYQNEAEYDVFEMWNDVARNYTLDADRAAVTGYSMGGYGTYRLGTLYPDLFGKAFSIVGTPGDGIWLPPLPPSGGIETLTNLWLENARNLPYLNVVGAQDELVPISGTAQQNIGPAVNGMTSFDALGYRFRFQVFNPGDHFHLALLSYDLPQGAEFLGSAHVDRNPDHVTYSYSPATDNADLGLVHNHAYWVSDVGLADMKAGSPVPEATVDVRSHARGRGDPPSVRGQGVGNSPTPYTEINRSWGEPPTIPAANKLTATLTNVGTATLDARRAGLDLNGAIELDVTATAAGVVRLAGDGTMVEFALKPGANSFTVPAGDLARSGAEDGRSGVLPATGSGSVALPLAVLTLTTAVALRRIRRSLER